MFSITSDFSKRTENLDKSQAICKICHLAIKCTGSTTNNKVELNLHKFALFLNRDCIVIASWLNHGNRHNIKDTWISIDDIWVPHKPFNLLREFPLSESIESPAPDFVGVEDVLPPKFVRTLDLPNVADRVGSPVTTPTDESDSEDPQYIKCLGRRVNERMPLTLAVILSTSSCLLDKLMLQLCSKI